MNITHFKLKLYSIFFKKKSYQILKNLTPLYFF